MNNPDNDTIANAPERRHPDGTLPDATPCGDTQHSAARCGGQGGNPQGCIPCGADTTPCAAQQDIPDPEGDALLDELQSLWDDQSRRIDNILVSHPGMQPQRLRRRCHTTRRRQVMAEYLILALINLAAGGYAFATLFHDPYVLIRVTGYLLAATNTFLAAHCIIHFAVILRHHPARVGTLRMSLFIRRMHMEPHYAPRRDRRRKRDSGGDTTHAVPPTPAKAGRTLLRPVFPAAASFSSARQVAAVSATVLIVLVAVSCAPIGDGHAMTKANRAERADAIMTVDKMLGKI